MKKLIEPDFKPKTDIEEYYNDNFGGFNILQINQVGWLPNLTKIEPLEFLNLFYEKIELIKINKKTPITLSRYLINLDLDKGVLKYLISQLSHFIKTILISERFGNEYDSQLMVCKRCIDNEYYKMFPVEEGTIIDLHDYDFDFDKVKCEVDKINTIKEKIKFLIIKKTKFLQKYGHLEKDGKFITLATTYDTHFLSKCNLELNMLIELSKLNGEYNSSFMDFKFKNNFDNVSKETVYKYFYDQLVKRNLLSEKQLQQYLVDAFQNKKPPKNKYILNRGNKTIADIRKIFHKYYKDYASSPRGSKRNEYIKLLTSYFSGHDFDATAKNFRS
jgi:hypothetical protein